MKAEDYENLLSEISEKLEKKDKDLVTNGYDLQHQFRQGFMLAQEIVNNTINKGS